MFSKLTLGAILIALPSLAMAADSEDQYGARPVGEDPYGARGIIQQGQSESATPQRASGTFQVTVVEDTADGLCDSHCSLREAVQAANAQPGRDTIMVPAGHYMLSIAGRDESAAASGDLDLLEEVTLEGAGADATIIDGAGIDRVFAVRASGIRIDKMTVTGGYALGGSAFSETKAVAGPERMRGGGILVAGNASLEMASCAITGNQAESVSFLSYVHGGGGLYIGPGAVASLDGCTLSANSATGTFFGAAKGGGVYVDAGATLGLTNSTVVHNEILGGGFEDTTATAGLYVVANGAADIASSTFSENPPAADSGGIVADSGATVILSQTILEGACSGALLSLGGNLESPGNTCGFVGPGDQVNIPAAALSLGPLEDNGGGVATCALLPGSAAIDAGIAGGCPAVDQRGNMRPQDGSGDGIAECDIGAYEADGIIPPPPPYTLGMPLPGLPGALNTLEIVGATPGEESLLYISRRLGETPIGGCSGYIGLRNPRLKGLAVADSDGTARISFNIGSGASGKTFYLQSFEAGTCTLSNVITVSF